MLNNLMLIAAGGAVGASARYLTMELAARRWGLEFPYGTLAVNVLGSFAMGVLVGALARFMPENASVLRSFFAIGVLGSYTTFSTFSLDVVSLIERGQMMQAGGYVALSVAACVLGLILGLMVWRLFPA